MTRSPRSWQITLLLAIGVLLVTGSAWHGAVPGALAQGDPKIVPFVPTPQNVVERMLELAEVQKDDLVYDLGSGDGRIVIMAAKKYGVRAIGFEIDDDLLRQSRENAQKEGVQHLVEFRKQDLMTVDLSPVNVLTLYLLPEVNLRLRPRILSQMRTGARVVSHDFDMGDWKADHTEEIKTQGSFHESHTIYLWRLRAQRPRP